MMKGGENRLTATVVTKAVVEFQHFSKKNLPVILEEVVDYIPQFDKETNERSRHVTWEH